MEEPSNEKVELSSQEFVEQANSKEKMFGHNKFQIEIQEYKEKIILLEQELSTKKESFEKENKEKTDQLEKYNNLQKTFEQVKQTYENRISNLSTQYENLKKQLQQKVEENEDLNKRYKLEYPKVTDLYTDIDVLKNDLHEISVNRDSLNEKLLSLTEMYDVQNKKLESKNDEYEQAVNELNLQKSICQSLEKEIDILKGENINYKNKVEDLSVLLDEKEEELTSANNLANKVANLEIKENTSPISVPKQASRPVRLYGSRRRKN